MIKYLFILRYCFFVFTFTACQQKTTQDNDAQLQEQAQQLAKKFIITDGHIDLPYRLREKMEDISMRTASGHFDYVSGDTNTDSSGTVLAERGA